MNGSELYEIAKKYENHGEIEKAYQCYLEAALAEDEAKEDSEKLSVAMDYYREAGERGVKYGYECLGRVYIDLGVQNVVCTSIR